MNWEILAIVSLVLATIPVALTLLNLRIYRPLPSSSGPLPPLSVLIPARDEAANIGPAIEAVLANTGVDFELIILDDHSTDPTAEIVARATDLDPRIRLETAPPLPEGWCGKQHACHILASRARHPLLVFTDADVRLAPDALARMAAAMAGPDAPALASGFPRQILGSFGEKLLLPLIHFILLGFLPMHFMRWTLRTGFSAGCGQLFIARRAAYLRTGGHAMIRTSLHDGVKLPRLFRRHRFATDLFDATGIASCRMYQNGAEVIAGLGKNATEGIAAPGTILPMTVLLAGGQILPFLLLATPAPLAVTLAACVLALLPRFIAMKKFRHPLIGVLLHPLGVLVLLAIQWHALFRRLAGRPARWKARSYKPTAAALLALITIFTQLPAAAQPAKAPARIELDDQFGKAHRIEFPAKQITILSLADRAGREQAMQWIAVLQPYADRAIIRGIADAKGTPGILKDNIRKRILKSHPHPLLIDWTGRTCARIGYRPGVANILIIARDGRILHRSEGPPTPQSTAKFTAALKAILRER